MHRAVITRSTARYEHGPAGAWHARRWYYTARTQRAYSVRQTSPGDRRLLAEFAVSLAPTGFLLDRASADADDGSVGFVALESTSGGDRVIGVCAYAPQGRESCALTIAVANSFREEQVGRTLLTTLLRHAKRAGVRRLVVEISWSNRAMQMLAFSMGFVVEAVATDRSRRRLVLALS